MIHRSPLVNLGGLVVAFAGMFAVNLVSAPSGPAATGEPSPGATATMFAPAPTASSPAPPSVASATPPTSARPRPSVADKNEFPDRVVYAGRTNDQKTSIAVAILARPGGGVPVRRPNVESWLRGTAKDGQLRLRSRDGSRLEAELDGDAITGTVAARGRTLKFMIDEAEKPAGLYRARSDRTVIGWIVLADGSQVGIAKTGSDVGAAPRLDVAEPTVTVDGQDLTAAPVAGDQDL